MYVTNAFQIHIRYSPNPTTRTPHTFIIVYKFNIVTEFRVTLAPTDKAHFNSYTSSVNNLLLKVCIMSLPKPFNEQCVQRIPFVYLQMGDDFPSYAVVDMRMSTNLSKKSIRSLLCDAMVSVATMVAWQPICNVNQTVHAWIKTLG